jgi:hypothetical protein
MYSDDELKAAFDKVCSPTDWKKPINSIIEAKDKNIVAEAIMHYTATTAYFEKLPNTNEVNKDMWLRVKAAGYRMGPAGDF